MIMTDPTGYDPNNDNFYPNNPFINPLIQKHQKLRETSLPFTENKNF